MLKKGQMRIIFQSGRFFLPGSAWMVALLLAFGFLQAQGNGSHADDILGTYSAYDNARQENFHLNFYKADNGEYQARIIWMDQPTDDLGKPRTDVNNPRSEQRHIPLSHLVIVRGLRYDARSKEWQGGRVYDPMSGKTYRCFIEFESENVIRMRGYIGFRFLGKSFYWSKLPD